MRAAGFAAALGLVVVLAAPARAEDGDPWLSGLARQLGENPVVVSDSVSRAISAAEVSRLRAIVRAMPVPTRVAIISGHPDDVRVSDLPDLLGGAVDKPGLYLVADATDDFLGDVEVASVAVRPRVPADDIERAVYRDVGTEGSVFERIRYALRVAQTGVRPRKDVAARKLDADVGDREDPYATEDIVAFVFLGVGAVGGFALPTVRWWRRRPGRARGAHGLPAVREPGPDTAREASAAVARLSAAIDAAEQPPDAAFDLYSAASKADREARTPVDSIGALVLAQDGADVLAGRPRRQRCFFDPDHRGTMTTTRWRLGDEEAEVPACERCALALREGGVPGVLGDRGRPYYERDTIWARTGFGTVDDELAEKVLSGR